MDTEILIAWLKESKSINFDPETAVWWSGYHPAIEHVQKKLGEIAADPPNDPEAATGHRRPTSRRTHHRW